jgi:protoheme IX farnesyltransferase
MLRQEAVAQSLELPVAVVRPASPGALDTAKAYLALTKPRIVVLLLVTTLPAMILAGGELPSPWLAFLTLAGGMLAAGGANAINCYIDRDIDSLMARTRGRPLPAGAVEPERALLFGILLGIISFQLLALGVNLASAFLALAALMFYVFVYTLWLKRSTDQNIVIGGAAGAMPPLVGYAAVTGGLDWAALALFGVIFLWTPPHFWALAQRYKADYARASVPMMPVVRGEAETNRQSLLYTVALVACSLALVPAASMGPVYITTASLLGAGFLALSLRLWRNPRPSASRAVFSYSLAYLALLFVAIGVDPFVA